MTDDLRLPAPLCDDRLRAPTLRSRLMLETVSELVGRPEWTLRQARIQLREQGASSWALNLAASDSLDSILELARGEIQFGIVNPAIGAAIALRGAPPFPAPVEIRTIATEPSFDQLGLAVRADLGITTVSELVARKPALRLSLRGQRDHSVRTVIDHVLVAAGASLDDIATWGGTVREDRGLPHLPFRRGLMAAGELDACFDEGIYNWVGQAIAAGFVFLAIDPPVLDRLMAMGHRRSVLTRARFPQLSQDVATVDFSGFLVYTHAVVDDAIVEAFCASLHARASRIPWQGSGPLPLARMVGDAVDAPITVPFHPAAERYWRKHGLLA